MRAGNAVAFPTDTVYGLGALAYDSDAIEELFEIKDRQLTQAIAVLLADAADLEKVTRSPSPAVLRLAEALWPGPLTMVVPAHPDLPDILSPKPTIGLRIPDHDSARALLRKAGPLAVTSANRSGGQNTRNAEEVYEQLSGLIPLILDGGRTPGGVPSTVVDLTGERPKILRLGPVTQAQIDEAVG